MGGGSPKAFFIDALNISSRAKLAGTTLKILKFHQFVSKRIKTV